MNTTAANPSVTGLALSAVDRTTATLTREPIPWVTVAGAFLFSTFWGIRSFGIQDNNEGVYAEVAREMNLRHDWVVPHLNGVPYLEKPPLLYWLEAILLRTFGDHEWVVRLGPILCFAVTILAVIWIGRRIYSFGLGRNAALILCTATGVVGMSRSLLFDGPLTCALTWVFACFLEWRLIGSRGALRACYGLLAVGVMAKGLIALVLGGGTIVIATFIARYSWRYLWRLADAWGVALFAAIVVPWHVMASAREPGFAEFYFINEHVRRFLGVREPHDFYTGPVYYYIVRLPLYLGIWSFALPVLAGRRGSSMGRRTRAQKEGRRILVTAVLLSVAFFSLSQGKANYYLLSIMPAGALLLAMAWPKDGVRRRRLFVCVGGAALIGLTYLLVPVLSRSPRIASILGGQELLLAAAGVGLLALAIAMGWFVLQRQNSAVFGCLGACGLVIFLPAAALLRRANDSISQRAVAEFLRTCDNFPVVLYRDYEKLSSLVYYSGRPVPIVDSESNELYYAKHHYPDRPAFLSAAQLHQAGRDCNVWIVTTDAHTDQVLREFATEGAHVVRRFPHAVVLAIGPTFASVVDDTSRQIVRASAPHKRDAGTAAVPLLR